MTNYGDNFDTSKLFNLEPARSFDPFKSFNPFESDKHQGSRLELFDNADKTPCNPFCKPCYKPVCYQPVEDKCNCDQCKRMIKKIYKR